jgi:hypothetical protein
MHARLDFINAATRSYGLSVYEQPVGDFVHRVILPREIFGRFEVFQTAFPDEYYDTATAEQARTIRALFR